MPKKSAFKSAFGPSSLESRVFENLLTLAGRWSAVGDVGYTLYRKPGLRKAFSRLGIESFFVCPYLSEKHEFSPPDRELMVVNADNVVLKTYLTSEKFREVKSTLRNAVICYVKQQVLEILRLKGKRNRKIKCSLIKLEKELVQTIERSGQMQILEDLPEEGIYALLKELEIDLELVYKQKILRVNKNDCELISAPGLDGYVPSRVAMLDERVASLVWDAFCMSIDPENANQQEQYFRHRMVNLLETGAFLKAHGLKVKWPRVWDALCGCLPECSRVSGETKRVDSLEIITHKLFRMWTTFASDKQDAKERNDLFKMLADHVVVLLPARAFAVRSTRWEQLLIVPVILEKSLAGVFFAEYVWKRRRYYQVHESRYLQALIQLFAARQLLRSSYRAEKERIEKERMKYQEALRCTSHFIATPIRKIISDLDELNSQLENLDIDKNDFIGPELISECIMSLRGLKNSAVSTIRHLGGQTKLTLNNWGTREICERFLDQYQAYFERLGISVDTKELVECKFKGDGEVLEILLGQIVHNAIDHITVEGCRDRRIHFASGTSADGRVILNISNSGSRVSEDKLKEIRWAVHHQASGIESTKGKGRGFGLVTVGKLLQHLHEASRHRVTIKDIMKITGNEDWVFKVHLVLPT